MPLSPLFSFSFKVCVSLAGLRCKARAPTWTPSFRARRTLELPHATPWPVLPRPLHDLGSLGTLGKISPHSVLRDQGTEQSP